MGVYIHFKESEFDSPDDPGSGRNMDPKLLSRLDMMREFCGFAFHVNSGVRSTAHNAKVGGKDNSEHLIQIDGLAHAADIACPDSTRRYLMIQSALKYGIRRIGVGDNFIHFGNWYQAPMDVIWVY